MPRLLTSVSAITLAAFLVVPTAASGPGGKGEDFPALNVSLLSHLDLLDFSASFAEDCWGYVSSTGREYAIIGLSTGTAFVEITDPSEPVIVEIILTPNQGRDMKVVGDYVYTSSDSGPTHVIDVSDIDNGVVTLANTIDGGTHNIAVNPDSNFIYAAIGGPLVVADVSDPLSPVQVGIWDGEAHDAQVVTYKSGEYAGREIAFVFAGSSGNVDIVDVSNKQDMFLVGRVTYPNATYTHQGWLSDDRQLLYASDELDNIQRTLVFDVSDLAEPVLINEFTTGLESIDHNLYVRDGVIYQANYTSGLRIFDGTCNPVDPIEVGYFDTFPSSDAPGFSGAWSNYPFFPSGTVIVSDRQMGLFVLDVSAALALVGCPSCPQDLNDNGAVDFPDLLDVLSNWGPCAGCAADFDEDGDVGFSDLLLVLSNWGPC